MEILHELNKSLPDAYDMLSGIYQCRGREFIWTPNGKDVKYLKSIRGYVIESDFWSSGDGDINKSVMNKLSEITDIKITIPEIHVPEINMPVLRAT